VHHLLGCIGIHKQSVFDLGVVESPGCNVAIRVVNGNINMVAISTTYSSVEVTLFLFHQEPSACCNAKKRKDVGTLVAKDTLQHCIQDRLSTGVVFF
jgi:hypothetical protein